MVNKPLANCTLTPLVLATGTCLLVLLLTENGLDCWFVGRTVVLAETQPTIGWVSAKTTVRPTNQQSSPFSVKSSTSRQVPVAKTNGVSVQFANGLLTIHSSGATLSEVLFQIQKQTGAEIAIPSGTEQDRVAADFGPAPASEVLGELLNGSAMNYVVVGSEADPNKLRSVILTQKTGGIEPTPG